MEEKNGVSAPRRLQIEHFYSLDLRGLYANMAISDDCSQFSDKILDMLYPNSPISDNTSYVEIFEV